MRRPSLLSLLSTHAPAVLFVLGLGACALPPAHGQSDDPLDQGMANRHAKRICSGVFLSEREASDIVRQDHDVDPATHEIEVDHREATVEVTTPGGSTGRAAWRPGLGCTILHELTVEELRAQPTGNAIPRPLDPDIEWPLGSQVSPHEPDGLDQDALERVLDEAFSEPEETNRRRGTRGVVVVQDGRIVAERYAPGFAPDRPIIAWSMTKTVTAAMLGMLVADEKLDVFAPAPVDLWHAEPGDPRSAITIDHLMRMSSGLEFAEVYRPGLIDVVLMLFSEPDMGRFAADKPLEAPPDTKWHYSSGTTNILQRIVRQQVGSLEDYVALARRELFDRLGMAHTFLELDESGTFVGSSFMYSTPRDMARFGQLLLQDGHWPDRGGERLLPAGWIEYLTTPTPAAEQGQYGAQTWLNVGAPDDPADRRWPSVPTDAFGLSGYEGQSVTVVPSRNAVVVRMGRTVPRSAFDLDAFLAGVLGALP